MLLPLLMFGCVYGADRPAIDVPRAAIAPLVSADPADPAWDGAPQVPVLGPCLGQDATGLPTTSVAARWDAGFLYLRFRCVDAHPLPAAADKDPYTGDAVEVFLDAAGDARTYLELQVGSDGRRIDHLWLMTAEARSEADGVLVGDLIKREQWQIPAWPCPGLRTAAQRTPNGWLADIALPAGPVLRRTGKTAFAPMELRANLLRLDYGDGPQPRLLAWSPVVPGRPHRSPQACGTFHLVGDAAEGK